MGTAMRIGAISGAVRGMYVVDHVGYGFVALGGDGDDGASPSAGLADVAQGLFVEGPLGDEGNDGHVLVDERYGAVLHLACGVALGVDVADLLEFQGTLHREREGHSASNEEEVGEVEKLVCEGLVLRFIRDEVAEHRRQVGQFLHESRGTLLGQRSS